MRVRRLAGLGLLGAALLLGSAGGASAAERPLVFVLTASGIVDGVRADTIAAGVARAEAEGAEAFVLRLDTPGGSLEATNRIVGVLLEARIPTIVWVAPAGGRAASAGTFITLAGAVALMAGGTSIGAASPIDSGGGDIAGTLGEKVRQDAIAKIRAIAERRGRNAEWAVSAVETAVAASAEQAVALGVVDGIADDEASVLRIASGREVAVAGGTVRLALEGAEVRRYEMNPLQAGLHLLSDPNIAFVLFLFGLLGLGLELFNPNLVTGTVGAISLVLAFVGFGSLPLDLAGVLLLGLAGVLFVAEAFIVSHGLLALGGVAALALGGSALYTEPTTPFEPSVAVALPLLGLVVGVAAALMAVVVVGGVRSRRIVGARGTVGEEALPAGSEGEVRHPLEPDGTIYAGGEEWSARTADGRPLGRGARVRVVRREDLTAIVEAADPVEGATPPAGRAR
jgi:membrane-bound serine protease (ClpP class)